MIQRPVLMRRRMQKEPERAELLLWGDEWDGGFNEMTSQAPPIPHANEGLSLYPDQR